MSKATPKDQDEQPPEPQPQSPLLSLQVTPRPRSASSGQGWLLTFTDLVALLITFFVMLFAMSTIEERKWHNLTNALSRNLDVVREVSVAIPRDDLDVETIESIPGTDLDYLAFLLEESIEADETLAGVRLHREADRLTISLPGELFFDRGEARLLPDGKRAVASLSGALRNLSNRIEVTGSAEATAVDSAAGWELSLTRAARVAALLGESGYQRPIVVRGMGNSRAPLSVDVGEPGARSESVARVVIAVHDDAGEVQR